MKVEFGYGKGVQIVDIPDKNLDQVLVANEIEHERRGPDAVVYALENPIGSPRLKDLAKPGQKIVIVTSDISRPLPSFDVIPSILDELYLAGCDPKDITVVFALGSHRPHTEEEKKKLVGERVYSEVKCIDSDPSDCIHMGDTSRGTPVDITRSVAEADFRIGVGNIEFHYFAGYSGGAKALMPGVSTPSAIQANHRMMVDEKACAGNLNGNPIRADIEESETFCHFSLTLSSMNISTSFTALQATLQRLTGQAASTWTRCTESLLREEPTLSSFLREARPRMLTFTRRRRLWTTPSMP